MEKNCLLVTEVSFRIGLLISEANNRSRSGGSFLYLLSDPVRISWKKARAGRAGRAISCYRPLLRTIITLALGTAASCQEGHSDIRAAILRMYVRIAMGREGGHWGARGKDKTRTSRRSISFLYSLVATGHASHSCNHSHSFQPITLYPVPTTP